MNIEKRVAILENRSQVNFAGLSNKAMGLEDGNVKVELSPSHNAIYRVVKKFVRLKKSILKFIFSDLFYSVLIGNSLLYQSLHLSDRSSLRIQLKTFFRYFMQNLID